MSKQYSEDLFIETKKFNPINYLKKKSFSIIITKFRDFLNSISPQKDLITNSNLLNLVKNKINVLSNLIKKGEKTKNIKDSNEFYQIFQSLTQIKRSDSEYGKRIKQIIHNNKDQRLTLKLIYEEYKNLYNENISIMTVSRVLRFHLGYHFRKTSIKNPKLEDNNSLIMIFIFLGIISRALALDLNLVYIDEVGFIMENSNYYTWKKDRELVYGGPKNNSKKKLNVILVVDENEILFGNLFSKNIGREEFMLFIDRLLDRMNDEEKENTLFIIDIAKFHVSKNVQEFLKTKKIKINKRKINIIQIMTEEFIDIYFVIINDNIYNLIIIF